MTTTILSFFADSQWVDRLVFWPPLSHVRPNWELTWDTESNQYSPEDDSFSDLLNTLISELENTSPPSKYHDNEDVLASYVQQRLNWGIKKQGNQWVNAAEKALALTTISCCWNKANSRTPTKKN